MDMFATTDYQGGLSFFSFGKRKSTPIPDRLSSFQVLVPGGVEDIFRPIDKIDLQSCESKRLLKLSSEDRSWEKQKLKLEEGHRVKFRVSVHTIVQ